MSTATFIPKRSFALALTLCVTMIFTQATAAASKYVTFDDGHLLVFPDTCLKDVRMTDTDVTFLAVDGKAYSYPLSSIIDISDQLAKELPVITSFKFNDKYNFQLIDDATGTIGDDAINAQVIGIGKWLTASFELSDERARAYVNGKEQQSRVSRQHYDTSKVYTVGYPGDMILARIDDNKLGFKPYGKTYTVTADFLTDHSTRVPRIDINTVGGNPIASKEIYLDAEIIIDGAGVFPSMTDSVQVKGRGNTSWSNNPEAKNPYRLKFASKKKPLGLTKGKSWVLLANKKNGSMLTNAIGMKAASLIGTAAANHIIPVDLYVNGVYKGSYNFTEKVGISNNSVEVADESVATLLKLDTHFDEAAGQKFFSRPYGIPCNVKDPTFGEADATVLTLAMVKERFNAMCQAVQDSTDLAEHIDIDYLARYLMLNELICNYEILHPKSGYCYHENILDDSCKFIFGPVWDFDWAFGQQTNGNYYRCNPAIDYYHAVSWGQSEFFTRLRNDPKVARRLYELWKKLVENDIDELCDYCQEYYRYAKPSLELNSTAASDNVNYADQCVRAANWLRQRAKAMLQVMRAEVLIPGDANGDGRLTIDDVTALIDYLLKGDRNAIDWDCADADNSGAVNIDDVTALINLLLKQ